MQRIDENTYIDETLVTCAEYQLFIDETREHGKYYQPDHWTSYQFPTGQAREPILGVRHSDALAFCGWLTNRNASEWNYLLPGPKEALDYPMKLTSQSLLGYWIMGADSQPPFIWIGSIPSDAREIASALALILDSDIDRDGRYNLSTARRSSTRGRSSIRDFYPDRTPVRSLPPRDFAGDLKVALEEALDRASPLDRTIYKHSIVRGLAFHIIRSRTRDTALRGTFNSALDSARVRAVVVDRELDLDRFPDLYVDILTLEERIAGRSPAFEGIRLVKERIK